MNLPIQSSQPTSSAPQNPAQAAHLQELQHQISIKTLAFQTLQREYDSLIQKLERQRTKCNTLERKFEVTDTEINTLTDDRERLQGMVTSLEVQVEKLMKSRDEARTQGAATNGQYLKIMEMSSRLSAQAAADKRQWAAEKLKFEARIAALEKREGGADKEDVQRSQHASPPPTEEAQERSEQDSQTADVPIKAAAEAVGKTASSDSEQTRPLLGEAKGMVEATVSTTVAPTEPLSHVLPGWTTMHEDLQDLLGEGRDLEKLGGSISKRGLELRSRCERLVARIMAVPAESEPK